MSSIHSINLTLKYYNQVHLVISAIDVTNMLTSQIKSENESYSLLFKSNNGIIGYDYKNSKIRYTLFCSARLNEINFLD